MTTQRAEAGKLALMLILACAVHLMFVNDTHASALFFWIRRRMRKSDKCGANQLDYHGCSSPSSWMSTAPLDVKHEFKQLVQRAPEELIQA
jgi:hypothetical protein